MKFSIKQILIVVIFLSSSNLFAQYNFVRNNSFIFPNENKFGEFKSLLSFTLAKLPEDVVEEASSYIYAPLINYNLKYGLPLGFTARGNVSTNWITFHLTLGGNWNYRLNRVSISLGYDAAYVFGELNKFGFNSKIKGWLNYPNIALGIAFNKFTLSFKVEASLLTSIKQFNDDIEVGSDRNRIAGASMGVYVEQPLWKNNFITLGFKGNYTRLYYPAWAVFPTWDRYNFIPEIIIGLIL